MKITDIKQQVRARDRYSVYIDGKYSFSLSELELINSRIRIGAELNRSELEGLKDTALFDKAYYRVLNLLARRQRSEWEIRDYLKRKEYDEAVTGSIINKLKNSGYVDDLKFAQAWVENRRLLKAISKRKLTLELKQKKVSDNIIKQVLDKDGTNEREVLRGLVTRKRKQFKYQDDLKLMQYLVRQGYNYDDIKTVMQDSKEL